MDSAEEMYSIEERRCCCCLGLFIGTWQAEEYGKKGITVSERNPCLPSFLCFPLHFTRSGSPSPCAKSVVLGWGFKGSRGNFLGDTSFHQVLMLHHAVEENPGNSLSQNMSWFRDTPSPPAEEVQGTLAPLDTPQPRTLTEGTGSPGRGGQAVGYHIPAPGKEYQWNKRGWKEQKKPAIDKGAVCAL